MKYNSFACNAARESKACAFWNVQRVQASSVNFLFLCQAFKQFSFDARMYTEHLFFLATSGVGIRIRHTGTFPRFMFPPEFFSAGFNLSKCAEWIYVCVHSAWHATPPRLPRDTVSGRHPLSTHLVCGLRDTLVVQCVWWDSNTITWHPSPWTKLLLQGYVWWKRAAVSLAFLV